MTMLPLLRRLLFGPRRFRRVRALTLARTRAMPAASPLALVLPCPARVSVKFRPR